MSITGEVTQEPVDIRGDVTVVMKGEDGLSAYEVAVKNGFVGTEEEWLESLKGEARSAKAFANMAEQYSLSAQNSSAIANSYALAAEDYKNEAQAIKDSISPEVQLAISAIQAEKEEAEAKKSEIDAEAEQAYLDRVQADADAAEVRYLYNETITQKNVATDAAERARLYALGAGTDAETAVAQAQIATEQAAAALASQEAAYASEQAAASSASEAQGYRDEAAVLNQDTAELRDEVTYQNELMHEYTTHYTNVLRTYDYFCANKAMEAEAYAALAVTSAAEARQAKERSEEILVEVSGYKDDVVLLASSSMTNAAIATSASLAARNSASEAMDFMAITEGYRDDALWYRDECSVLTTAVAQDASFASIKAGEAEQYAIMAASSALAAGNAETVVNDAIGIISQNTLDIVEDELSSQIAALTTSIGMALDTKLDVLGTAVLAENALLANGYTVESNVPPNAVFTDTTYDTMTITDAETGTDTTGKLVPAKVLADFVAEVISALVASAPGTLDTLNELATALGDDPNFATTMATELAKKLNKAGDTMTGDLTVQGTVTADSLVGALTGNVTGTASKATGDKNGNDITTTYVNLTGAQTISGNKTFTGETHIYSAINTASGQGLYIHSNYNANEGGQVNLCAPDSGNTVNGLIIDNYNGAFRFFGIPSKDGTTKTGNGTILNIDPYAKTITGGYTYTGNVTGNCSGSSGSCTGNAATATKATQDGSGNTITSTYVNLSGAQTITGAKTFEQPIAMKVTDTNSTTTRTGNVLTANSSNTGYGINIALGTGGNCVVGGGESATAQLNALAGNSNEDLYLTADGAIYLKPNCNTFANAKTITLNTSGEMSGLAKVTSTSFVGALTGNVTGNCSGSSGSCTGNAATATSAAACTGNSATASKAAQLTTARTIDGVSFNGTANITHYGSCSTAAATAAKTVACTGFTLATGAEINVKFTVTNTAANPTLNVNSTGAKAIYYRGAAISAGYLAANRTYRFVYNGTQYELVGDLDTNSNTDTLMTQNVSTTNSTYPILLCPTANATANQGAKTGIFGSGIKANPSTSTITAALSGNASTATKINGKTIPVVSSFSNGTLALTSLS